MLLSPTNSFSAECPVFALQQIELSLILANCSRHSLIHSTSSTFDLSPYQLRWRLAKWRRPPTRSIPALLSSWSQEKAWWQAKGWPTNIFLSHAGINPHWRLSAWAKRSLLLSPATLLRFESPSLSVSATRSWPKCTELTGNRLCYARQESCPPLQWQQCEYRICSTSLTLTPFDEILSWTFYTPWKAQSKANVAAYIKDRNTVSNCALWSSWPTLGKSSPAKKFCVPKLWRA
jgi:hypothetical protein